MVYRRDLPESTLANGEFLWCPSCNDRWAASRGDYFMVPDNEPFYCDDCNEPMALASESRSVHVIAS